MWNEVNFGLLSYVPSNVYPNWISLLKFEKNTQYICKNIWNMYITSIGTEYLSYLISHHILTMSNWTLFTWQYLQVSAHVTLVCLVGLWLFIYFCVSSALQSCILCAWSDCAYIHVACQMIEQVYGDSLRMTPCMLKRVGTANQ
jgi:hypothetical protein